jgi:hypothetical protein
MVFTAFFYYIVCAITGARPGTCPLIRPVTRPVIGTLIGNVTYPGIRHIFDTY